jgi:hypothetical protein
MSRTVLPVSYLMTTCIGVFVSGIILRGHGHASMSITVEVVR